MVFIWILKNKAMGIIFIKMEKSSKVSFRKIDEMELGQCFIQIEIIIMESG